MRIKNWKRFQHFLRRKPPWIKLYRELLDDHEWHRLGHSSAKFLINCWLLASEMDGELPPVGQIAFRLRLRKRDVIRSLSTLSHWIEGVEKNEICHQRDITTISRRYRDDTPETETETETETEKRSVAKNATAQVPVVVQSNEIQTTQQKTLQAEFVEKFKKTYEQQSGQPFKMDKKHFIIAANLIKSHGLEAVEQKAAILSVMCRDKTVWFTKDGWADFTIEKLSSQWNSIIPQATMTEEDKSKQRIAELFQKEHERNERVNKIVGNIRATRS